METALAILMVLGVYILAPAVIGFAIVGGTVLAARRRRARKTKVGLPETQAAQAKAVVPVRR